MRVLTVTPYYYPAVRFGGPVRSVHELAANLVKLGVEVTVFTTDMDGPQRLAVPLAREVWIDGVRVFYYPIGFPRSYARSAKLGRALKEQIRNFDLVHIHGLYTYPTMTAARECQRRHVPYLIAPRGMLDPHAIVIKGRYKKRLYLRLIEQRNLERAALLHFTTADEQQLAAQTGITTRGVVVPNALDLTEYPSDAERGAESARVSQVADRILFLSRIDPKKGLDLLIPAFAVVARARPGARLVIAGPDNGGYWPKIEALVVKHGLQDKVVYRGMLVGADKIDAYKSAALFVLPSYSENFGNVVIEAMACERPVVISDRVNLCHEVVAAHAGLVVPCDVAQLADAILTVLADPESGRTMGQRGRKLVEAKFTWSFVAAQMLKVYEQVLRDWRA
jgi:glycosyltransferase involved in cell wall biosynthesis